MDQRFRCERCDSDIGVALVVDPMQRQDDGFDELVLMCEDCYERARIQVSCRAYGAHPFSHVR